MCVLHVHWGWGVISLYAGPEVDVWSCGVILYAILCGSLPFDDENIRNLFRKIKGGVYTIPSYVSKEARDLISRMLVVDPLKRITIAEIRSTSAPLNTTVCFDVDRSSDGGLQSSLLVLDRSAIVFGRIGRTANRTGQIGR